MTTPNPLREALTAKRKLDAIDDWHRKRAAFLTEAAAAKRTAVLAGLSPAAKAALEAVDYSTADVVDCDFEATDG